MPNGRASQQSVALFAVMRREHTCHRRTCQRPSDDALLPAARQQAQFINPSHLLLPNNASHTPTNPQSAHACGALSFAFELHITQQRHVPLRQLSRAAPQRTHLQPQRRLRRVSGACKRWDHSPRLANGTTKAAPGFNPKRARLDSSSLPGSTVALTWRACSPLDTTRLHASKRRSAKQQRSTSHFATQRNADGL